MDKWGVLFHGCRWSQFVGIIVADTALSFKRNLIFFIDDTMLLVASFVSVLTSLVNEKSEVEALRFFHACFQTRYAMLFWSSIQTHLAWTDLLQLQGVVEGDELAIEVAHHLR